MINKKKINQSIFFIFLFFFEIVTDAQNIEELVKVGPKGIWAAEAILPYPGPEFKPSEITAPSKTVTIKANKNGLVLIGKGGNEFKLDILINPPLMEILWASDSKNFFINVSDGGLVGTWDTKVYSLEANGRPIFHDVRGIVTKAASKLIQCEPKEDANIGTVAWLGYNHEILVIVEVPPHSSCQNMGKIFGFRVSLNSNKIINRISEKVLRSKWTEVLGRRFEKNDSN